MGSANDVNSKLKTNQIKGNHKIGLPNEKDGENDHPESVPPPSLLVPGRIVVSLRGLFHGIKVQNK
jgi:hypothetical protein